MNAVITYREISNFIEKKFKARPVFSTIDKKTFEVSYSPTAFMPAIAIKVTIKAIRKDVVCLTYDCGKAASLIIAGVIAYLEEMIPNGIEINTADKYINIYPMRFKQMENALKHVSLSNITFEEKSVNIELSMVFPGPVIA